MSQAPINIKLRCASWQQLANIYRRDLARHAIFLKSSTPPPLGTGVRIDLTLPTESMIVLTGTVVDHVPEGGLGGRGPGIDIKLNTIPQSALWLIETALASAQKSQGAAPAAVATEAAADDGRDLVAAEDQLLSALTSELASLRKLNPFQVIGVGYEATDEDVRAAFAELTKRYHPDRFTRYTSTNLRTLAAEIFILIRDAYGRLNDEASRAKVVAAIGVRPRVRVPTGPGARAAAAAAAPTPAPPAPPAPPAQPPAPPERPSQARPALPQIPLPLRPPPPTERHQGVVPERRNTPPIGNPVVAPASPPERRATPPTPASTPPSSPERRATPPAGSMVPSASSPANDEKDLRAAEALLDAGRYDDALTAYKNFARRSPNDRGARAGLELVEGLRALAQRDRLEAAQRFETALEIDPTNERAARELAEMRRLATNERKGLLSRLMGKKE